MTKACSCTFALLPLAIVIGLGIGHFLPASGKTLDALIDPLVLGLLALIFFEVRFAPLREASRHLSFLSLAWIANFIIIPVLGWAIATLFFGQEPALFTGLLLYFLFPCTDWFLAFTRIAKGDVALGSVLIPINLISQLLLFPVYLSLFIGLQTSFDLIGIWGTLAEWFLLPFLGAMLLRLLLSKAFSIARFERITGFAGSVVPWALSALVLCIFSSHASQLTAQPGAFPLILLAVFLFFVLTWILGQVIAWRFRLDHAQQVLLAMTTTARNSPLMLGLATIILPNQPIVYAALIIGMLVEFPHLTILSRLFLRKESHIKASPDNPITTV